MTRTHHTPAGAPAELLPDPTIDRHAPRDGPAQRQATMDGDPPGTFEALARTADAIAETAEASADIHDDAADHLPDAAEHADRERGFAAAERAAARAYRDHQVPPDEVREVIREVRHRPDEPGCAPTSR